MFVELCPNASQDFHLSPDVVVELAVTDVAFQVSAAVRDLFVTGGRPAAILVNGVPAIENFEALSGTALRRARREYASVSNPNKRLWHNEGMLAIDDGATLAIGVPFLRTPGTHNSTDELGSLVASHVGSRSSKDTRSGR